MGIRTALFEGVDGGDETASNEIFAGKVRTGEIATLDEDCCCSGVTMT